MTSHFANDGAAASVTADAEASPGAAGSGAVSTRRGYALTLQLVRDFHRRPVDHRAWSAFEPGGQHDGGSRPGHAVDGAQPTEAAMQFVDTGNAQNDDEWVVA